MRNQKQSTAKSKKSRTKPADSQPNFSDYYPFFENLLLLLLDSSGWISGFKSFIRNELSQRGKAMIAGLFFICCSMAFIFSTIVFMIIGFFLFVSDLVGNQILAAFIISAVTITVTALLIKLAFNRFRRVLTPLQQRPTGDELADFDDDDF